MRHYFDWNASTALRPEAREAMISAFDLPGNPSSVHYEGRTAYGLIEHVREQIAELLDAQGADIIFTSGASEAAALGLGGKMLECAPIEHDAVQAWCKPSLKVSAMGRVEITIPERTTLQKANSETGIIQDLPKNLGVSDLTQAIGKIPFSFAQSGIKSGFLSAHKFGGPKGIGALIMASGQNITAQICGGMQEKGYRAGTQNVPAIAGLGAALKAALRDIHDGVWERVEMLKNYFEEALLNIDNRLLIVGKNTLRLPNTCCFIAPVLLGETMVIKSDLAGFAISAGSACSSGKVSPSLTLRAMGYDEKECASALRLSFAPDVTKKDVMRFYEFLEKTYQKAFYTQKHKKYDSTSAIETIKAKRKTAI